MRGMFDDTDEDAERVMIALLRNQPVWKRLARVDALYAACRELALADLRRAAPGATVDQLHERLKWRVIGDLEDADLRHALKNGDRVRS